MNASGNYLALNRRGFALRHCQAIRMKDPSPVILRRVERIPEDTGGGASGGGGGGGSDNESSSSSSTTTTMWIRRPMSPDMNKMDMLGSLSHLQRSNHSHLSVRRSVDLEAHDVQRLERLYGGKLKAHAAARKIQSAYRAYRIRKDYESIRDQKMRSQQPLSETLLGSPMSMNLSGPPITTSEPPPSNLNRNQTESLTIMKQDDATTTTTTMKTTTATMMMNGCNGSRDRIRRVFVTLFNQSPKRGLNYLLAEGFLQDYPDKITSFLMEEKTLSRVAVGEYFGLLDDERARLVFKHFLHKICLVEKPVDVALRFFLSHFHIPGESQKILYMMQAFQDEYCVQNPKLVSETFRDHDSITVLCYAIIMLHTDYHNPNINRHRNNSKMTCDQFVKNLRGVDKGEDIDKNLLIAIYHRTIMEEFKVITDPSTVVRKIAQGLIGPQTPCNLVDRQRRLIHFTTLHEVKDGIGFSQRLLYKERAVFLFNDSLLLAKTVLNKDASPSFSFKHFIPLMGVHVTKVNTDSQLSGDTRNRNLWLELKQVSDSRVLVRLTTRSRDYDTEIINSSTIVNSSSSSPSSSTTISTSAASSSSTTSSTSPSSLLSVSTSLSSELRELLNFHRLIHESILEVRELDKIRIQEQFSDFGHYCTVSGCRNGNSSNAIHHLLPP